jgi:hypothetical protein
MEDSEINLDICSQMFIDEGNENTYWRKDILLTNGVGKTDTHMQKQVTRPFSLASLKC